MVKLILDIGNMKHLESYKSKHITCENCAWSWQTESKDDRKYLCHKCGWDNFSKKFDKTSLKKWQRVKDLQDLPFKESKISNNIFIREFKQDTDSGEFMWHRDRETRIIESIGDTDWMIQMDNELPHKLDGKIKIPVGIYHRLIKGSGDLRIKLIKIYP